MTHERTLRKTINWDTKRIITCWYFWSKQKKLSVINSGYCNSTKNMKHHRSQFAEVTKEMFIIYSKWSCLFVWKRWSQTVDIDELTNNKAESNTSINLKQSLEKLEHSCFFPSAAVMLILLLFSSQCVYATRTLWNLRHISKAAKQMKQQNIWKQIHSSEWNPFFVHPLSTSKCFHVGEVHAVGNEVWSRTSGTITLEILFENRLNI